MFRFFFFFMLFAGSLFSFENVDREIARQFEQLVVNGSGVLPQLPPDVRSRRIGPVTQKVLITDDGMLIVSQNFICKEINSDATISGSCCKRFYLSDLKPGTTNKRYEVNWHVNTISLLDGEGTFFLSFQSERDLEKASKLLTTLVTRAPQAQRKPCAYSTLAKEAGYRYLVAAPRAQSHTEALRLLSFPKQSPCLVTWLTKHSPDQTDALLAESRNALPLLFYDLSILDTVPFFTQETPHLPSFSPCTLGNEMVQSIVCDDSQALAIFFEKTSFAGIRFEQMPDFSTPVAIISLPSDKHKLHKIAKTEKIETHSITWYSTKVFHEEEYIPMGTVSSWLTGLHENSDDILRYCLLEEPISKNLLEGILYREFPLLESLLRCKGHYRKDLCLSESICSTSLAMTRFSPQSSWKLRILKVALFSHELGAPFGPSEELFYNSWPLALCVAEKIGFNEFEKTALHALLEASLPCEGKNMKPNDSLSLLNESRIADQLGVPITDWIDLKLHYWEALSSIWKHPPTQASTAIASLARVQKQYTSICSFGISRGMSACKGPLPTCGVFSSYLWEIRDPHHRDGLTLKKRREKYEHMLVENPSSSWKGRFWEWIKKDSHEIASTKYLQPNERESFRAIFENGKLIHPLLASSQEEIECMFVVDEWGDIYVGAKIDGDDQTPAFNHASFFAAGPIAAAGKMIFKDGSLIAMTDRSGHYRPSIREIVRAIEAIEKLGVDIDTVAVYSDDCDKESPPSGRIVLETYKKCFTPS